MFQAVVSFDSFDAKAMPIPKATGCKVPDSVQGRNFITDHRVKCLAEYINLDMQTGPWLAGGSVRKMILGLPIGQSDLDIWCADMSQFGLVINRLDSLDDCWQTRVTENSINYQWSPPNGLFHVQVIRCEFFKTAQSILDYFDFTVCQIATDGNSILMGKQTLADLDSHTLRLTGQAMRKSIISRIIKYQIYGYTPCAELLEQVQSESENLTWIKDDVFDYDTF